MLALRVITWISCGITIILWSLYGFNIFRNKKVGIIAIVSTIIWVGTSIPAYSVEF